MYFNLFEKSEEIETHSQYNSIMFMMEREPIKSSFNLLYFLFFITVHYLAHSNEWYPPS